MRFLVLAIFVAIVVSLGTALFALFKDSGNSDRAVKALTIRVGLSVGLFVLLLVLTALGVISPR
ncbi:MAG: twin transmembrane helix small protein [Gammaproteobacteria bacterium]|nr:twin transmembrane helix small protein [Gammaproteobacteria bacterium]